MKICYIDQDGPLANFQKAIGRYPVESDPPEMYRPGFYLGLEVTEGAREAVEELLKIKDIKLYIATKHSFKSAYIASEKMFWVEKHFPQLLRRTILICDKGLLRGDFLIDDSPHRWEKSFQGQFLTFYNQYPMLSWREAIEAIRQAT